VVKPDERALPFTGQLLGEPVPALEGVRERGGRTLQRPSLPVSRSGGSRQTPTSQVHGRFFVVDEIEFDVDPKEIVGQEEFDAVCEVVRVIGQALGKPVGVTDESAHSQVIMRYDVSTDSFVRVPPPPTVSLSACGRSGADPCAAPAGSPDYGMFGQAAGCG